VEQDSRKLRKGVNRGKWRKIYLTEEKEKRKGERREKDFNLVFLGGKGQRGGTT